MSALRCRRTERGADVYDAQCSFCHDAVPGGTALEMLPGVASLALKYDGALSPYIKERPDLANAAVLTAFLRDGFEAAMKALSGIRATLGLVKRGGACPRVSLAVACIGMSPVLSAQSWSDVDGPAAGDPEAIGSYAAGCMIGAERLPLDGPGYQAVRPDRNRHYGHRELIAYIEQLAEQAAAAGLGLLPIGDISQPRGGCGSMSTGRTCRPAQPKKIASRNGARPDWPRYR